MERKPSQAIIPPHSSHTAGPPARPGCSNLTWARLQRAAHGRSVHWPISGPGLSHTLSPMVTRMRYSDGGPVVSQEHHDPSPNLKGRPGPPDRGAAECRRVPPGQARGPLGGAARGEGVQPPCGPRPGREPPTPSTCAVTVGSGPSGGAAPSAPSPPHPHPLPPPA